MIELVVVVKFSPTLPVSLLNAVWSSIPDDLKAPVLYVWCNNGYANLFCSDTIFVPYYLLG